MALLTPLLTHAGRVGATRANWPFSQEKAEKSPILAKSSDIPLFSGKYGQNQR